MLDDPTRQTLMVPESFPSLRCTGPDVVLVRAPCSCTGSGYSRIRSSFQLRSNVQWPCTAGRFIGPGRKVPRPSNRRTVAITLIPSERTRMEESALGGIDL